MKSALLLLALVSVALVADSLAAAEDTDCTGLGDSKCNYPPGVNNSALLQAAEHLQESRRLLLLPDCVNATDRADRAMDIYVKLYERDPGNIYYKSLINDTEDQKRGIYDTCGGGQPPIYNAVRFYNKAQELYLTGDYESALKYANGSMEVYKAASNYVGISKSSALISQIRAAKEGAEPVQSTLSRPQAGANATGMPGAAGKRRPSEPNQVKFPYTLVFVIVASAAAFMAWRLAKKRLTGGS